MQPPATRSKASDPFSRRRRHKGGGALFNPGIFLLEAEAEGDCQLGTLWRI
jgi:hypothetical protein